MTDSPLMPPAFVQWHNQEMARQAAVLVHAAGGSVRVTRQTVENLSEIVLQERMDHATGERHFTTDPDFAAFDASFEENRK